MMKPILTRTRIITFCIISILLLAGCVFYCRNLAEDFTGEIAVPTGVVNDGDKIALPAGDFRLDIGYSSNEDRELAIKSRDDEILYQGILSKGDDQDTQIAFVNPKEDCSISVILSEGEGEFTCTKLTLFSEREVYRDSAAKAVLLFIFGTCFLYFIYTQLFEDAKRIQKILWGMLACALCIRTMPFWYNGNVSGYDGIFHCGRIVGVADALRDGQFPVTIYPYTYNGFGMLGRMYPDLTLYPAAIFRFLGVSPIGSYQIFVIMLGIVGAAVMYYCVRSISRSDVSASIASIIFILGKYHLEDVFFRNAFGEVTGMCFIALTISGIYHIINRDSRKGIVHLVAGCVLVINSHVLVCIFVALMGIVMLLFYCREVVKWPVSKDFLMSALFTVLIGGGTLVPMFTHMLGGLSTSVLSTDNFDVYSNTFLTMFGLQDTVLPSLGFPALVIFAVMIVRSLWWVKNREKGDPTDRFVVCMLLISAVFALFASSVFPWTVLAKLGPVRTLNEYIQFVYRYFTVTVTSLAIGGSIAIEKLAGMLPVRKLATAIEIALVAIFIVGGLNYVVAYIPYESAMNRLRGGVDENNYCGFLPEGATEACFTHDNLFTSNPNINITLYEKHGTNILCQFYVTEEYNHIDFPLFYYLGYTAKYYVPSDMSGKTIPVTRGDEGRIRVVLPQTDEIAAVEIEYRDPWFVIAAYIISLVALTVLIWYNIPHGKDKKSNNIPDGIHNSV